MTHTWALSADLARAYVVAACVAAGLSVVLLFVELLLRRRRGGSVLVALSGILALSGLLAAVLRPVKVQERGVGVGPRVVLMVDASRSIDLPGDDRGTRRKLIGELLPKLEEHFDRGRTRTMVFGQGDALPYAEPLDGKFVAAPVQGSDLVAGLDALAKATDELPQAVVVVSDGRLDRPVAGRVDAEIAEVLARLKVPIHTISVAEADPRDASIRKIRLPDAVVAHQPVSLGVEIGCSGGLDCDDIAVVARELHLTEPPVTRASGNARVLDGKAELELEVVLDRAGTRILEVAIQAPDGDTIADNDVRYLTVDVARDRVRLLHVAGRPTYDVRALRHWLKSDASVDVVAFFILRTRSSQVLATQDELALIPFPVDELFTSHLPSFDAVVLQDFDHGPYGLTTHLPRLARYVRQGGGLIMVGGPNAFAAAGYGRTSLSSVLPVTLEGIGREQAADFAGFVPQVTEAGRRAPVLEPVRAVLGDAWPEMPGTNVVGEARDGATVLLEHPTLKTAAGSAMPLLALGEYGSGRTIALTVDGAHRLLFSTFAVDAGGRGHGAFWDGLLGWLMRDPRFEPVHVTLPKGCIAREPTEIELRVVFGGAGDEASVTIARMGSGDVVYDGVLKIPDGDEPVRAGVGALAAGGYTTTVRLQERGETAPSHFDFACEVGGDEWADPRPDTKRLAKLAEVAGGVAVSAADYEEIPQPESMQIIAERRVQAVLPPWAWSLIAALLLGGHWFVRRRTGLA